ncbi:hypothetical protein ACJW30_03G069500 [Castanea mollissima]
MQMGKLTKQSYHHLPKNEKLTKSKQKPIKITYISSPTMVRACHASEFRKIVQELTGNNSDDIEIPGDNHAASSEQVGLVFNHEAPYAKTAAEIVGDPFLKTMNSLELDQGYFLREVLGNIC